MLTAQQMRKDENQVIQTKKSTVSSCNVPLCLACQLAKQARWSPGGTTLTADPSKFMATKKGHLVPGQVFSIDQYMGSTPGHLPRTKGETMIKDKYTRGTLLVNHASGFVYVRNQVSLKAGEKVVSKKAFDSFANTFGVRIKGYLADNVPFNSAEFRADLTSKSSIDQYR
jgi:hypothetical protein